MLGTAGAPSDTVLIAGVEWSDQRNALLMHEIGTRSTSSRWTDHVGFSPTTCPS